MIGSRIGAYDVVSELGSGGMGTVYLAKTALPAAGLEVGASVALKVIHPNLLSQPGFFKRFLREARIGQQLEHENVVRTFDCDATMVDERQLNFLVMEYVEGQNLRDLLAEQERVPEELCRHIGCEVAKGLAAIHEVGVLHRDIKPENVLITEHHVVKVMDLGVARLQDEAIRLSKAGAFVGSVEYASPEQFRGGREPDGRADLHALGVMLYELTTGQHPYRHEDVRRVLHRILHEEPRRLGEVNPQLSPFLEEVIRTLLAKERDDRFASAHDLMRVLDGGDRSEWWSQRAKALRVESRAPLRRIRVARETALYGRDEELERLRALYELAKQGEGRVVLIEGESGIGKTRLVDEFVGRLRHEGEDLNFLFGSYPPGGAATASGAFSTAYREQFGDAGLEESLQEYLTATPLLIPAFAALLRGDATPTSAEPLTQDSMQTVFVHATRALAAERTTIVSIDDLHFAPTGGLALFASLAMAAPGHRILLVGTGRPGMSEEWVTSLQRCDASRWALSRLGPKDLAQLLEDAFQSERLAKELGHQIAVKSDGNPFFAFEIIRGLREGNFISQADDGSWISTKQVQEIQVPSSVLDLIHARLRDLSEEERELLDVAACCGFAFDPELVAQVVGMRSIPALRAFGRVEKAHRLVRSVGRDFAFDHHQVQEALYTGQPERLRERYHAAIADGLESRAGAGAADAPEPEGSVAVELCRHYFAGVRGEKAIRHLHDALAHLEAHYLNDQAIELAGRALAEPRLVRGADRVELLLRKAARHDVLGQHEAQRAAYEEALSLADADGDETLRARVRLPLGLMLHRIQAGGAGRTELGEALELARAGGDRRSEARALGNLALTSRALGCGDEAVAYNERALAIYRELGDRQGEASCLGNLGILFGDRGLQAKSRECYERCLQIFRGVGNLKHEVIVTHNLGTLFRQLGRPRQAQECFLRCVSISREIGFRAGEEAPADNLAELQGAMGHTDAAGSHFEQRLARDRESGHRHLEVHTLYRLGEIARASGSLAEAERRFREALAMLREIEMPRRLAETVASLGGVLAEGGRHEEAAPLLDEALGLARRWRHPAVEVQAVCHRALAPMGDATSAHRTLSELAGHLDCETAIRARFLLWKATGDSAHAREGRRLLDEFVAQAPEEDRSSMLENVRLYQEIQESGAEGA